jgi:hypothetical protein
MFPNATPTGVLGNIGIGTTLPLVRLIQGSQLVIQSDCSLPARCPYLSPIYHLSTTRPDKRHLPLCQHAELLSNCGATFYVPRKVVF